jgi:LytS/YehU family sensor histidine kinase
MRRRTRLSRKTFLSLVIAQMPMAFTLILNLFVDAVLLFGISYVLSALVMYSLVLSDQIEQDFRHQQRIAEQQGEIARQRANVMVLQMRPHFIYNTLTSIHCLCKLNPEKAQQVTMDFTNYLRKNFNAIASDSTIPFSMELEHTRAYLAVEKAQHEDMLSVDYDTPFTYFRLPSLTLQPIVENSVKHGMDPYHGPLHISIRTRRTDSVTEIIVEDNGSGFDLSDENRPHTALDNIRQRLELMCAGKLDVMSRDGGGTTVTVTIPDQKEEG